MRKGHLARPLVVFALLALLLAVPQVLSASRIVVAVPGKTVVQDDPLDFLLRNCDPAHSDRPCSLPPGAPLSAPPWMDIKTARITQVGRGEVDLVIVLQAPVPPVPPFGFVAYFVAFENGCIGTGSGPTNKDVARVFWNGTAWEANWVVITSCDPRTVSIGSPIPFRIVDDTVRMRVNLEELVTQTDVPLLWFAGTRRLPFVHPTFTRTIEVDVAPDVIAFNLTPPPDVIHPEPAAPWLPR